MGKDFVIIQILAKYSKYNKIIKNTECYYPYWFLNKHELCQDITIPASIYNDFAWSGE